MPRTTLNIEAAVLDAIRERARREGKPLGNLVSELLRGALKNGGRKPPRSFVWIAKPMGIPKVNIDSNADLWEFFDREDGYGEPHGTHD